MPKKSIRLFLRKALTLNSTRALSTQSRPSSLLKVTGLNLIKANAFAPQNRTMSTVQNNFKTEFANLEPRNSLKEPITVLYGVNQATANLLKTNFNINNIFDLACSKIFANARLLSALGSDESDKFMQLGTLPGDIVDAGILNRITLNDLKKEDINILKGIGNQNGPQLQSMLGIITVRDLALWPPYLAARKIMQNVFSFDQATLDSGTPPDLLPASGKFPTERAFYSSFVIGEPVVEKKADDEKKPVPEAGTPVPAPTPTPAPEAKPVFGLLANHLLPMVAIAEAKTETKSGPISTPMALSRAVKYVKIDMDDFLLKKFQPRPRLGALLTFEQAWYSYGLSLGQLLHSVGLAPGQSKRIANIDWSRRTSTTTTEEINETDDLTNRMDHSRSISEVTNSVAKETQSGKSGMLGGGAFAGAGGAAGGQLGPVSIGGSGGAGVSAAGAIGWSSSKGRREITTNMTQNINDTTQQHAHSVRNRRASIIREATQKESEQVSTSIIVNYNHMHALTIQYWEVVQAYRVVVKLAVKPERCLFWPIPPIDFNNEAIVEKYRLRLAAGALDSNIAEILKDGDNVVYVKGERSYPRTSLPFIFKDFGYEILRGNLKLFPKAKFTQDRRGVILPSQAVVRGIFYPYSNENDEVKVVKDAVSNITAAGTATSTTTPTMTLKFDKDHTVIFDESIPLGALSSLWLKAPTIPDTGMFPGAFIETFRTSIFSEWNAARARRTNVFVYLHLEYRGNELQWPVPIKFDENDNLQNVVTFNSRLELEQHQVAEHLNANREHYSRVVYESMDSYDLSALLSSYVLPGHTSPLIENVDLPPLTVAGNSLVFKMPAVSEDEQKEWDKWLVDHGILMNDRHESIVPMPSGGVFGEAVLGRANSAEKLDLTRYWKWDEAPIPDKAPEIAPIQTGSRAIQENLTPGQLSQPIVGMMTPSSLPDPTGTAAALAAITQGNMFRDMSNSAAVANLATTALTETTRAVTEMAGQASENMRAIAPGGMGGGGGGGVPSAGGGGGSRSPVSSGVASALTSSSRTSAMDPSANLSNVGAVMNYARDMDSRRPTPATSPSTLNGNQNAFFANGAEPETLSRMVWGANGESNTSALRAASFINMSDEAQLIEQYKKIIRSPEYELAESFVVKVAEKLNKKTGTVLDHVTALVEVVNVIHDLGDLADSKKTALEALIKYPRQTIELYVFMSGDFTQSPDVIYNSLFTQIAQNRIQAAALILDIVEKAGQGIEDNLALNNFPPLSTFVHNKRMQALNSIIELAKDIVKVTPYGRLVALSDILSALKEIYKKYLGDASTPSPSPGTRPA